MGPSENSTYHRFGPYAFQVVIYTEDPVPARGQEGRAWRATERGRLRYDTCSTDDIGQSVERQERVVGGGPLTR